MTSQLISAVDGHVKCTNRVLCRWFRERRTADPVLVHGAVLHTVVGTLPVISLELSKLNSELAPDGTPAKFSSLSLPFQSPMLAESQYHFLFRVRTHQSWAKIAK